MSSTAKLLRELIALPSVNPAFLPDRDAHAGEKCVADYLAVTAARSGLEVEFQDVLPARPNVIVRLLPQNDPRQRLLLAPHLDTVSVAHESQFTPRTKNGRIYGRGACDTKGSAAAMLMAVCELAKLPHRPRDTEIVFAGLVDEENAQAGSRALTRKGMKADLAIVGEPTRLQVITAHKGSLWLELETRGRAAHGAAPQLGRNAVHEMARIVDCLQTVYAADLKQRGHNLLGHATVSVGVICGGTQANIVPDRCTITIDRRTLPGETKATVTNEIKSLLRSKELCARIMDTKVASCQPLETNANLPLVREFLRCVGQKQPLGAHFFCDAAVLAEAGTPSVVFGPGDVAQAHTANEWVSIRSLERAKDKLVHFLKSLP